MSAKKRVGWFIAIVLLLAICNSALAQECGVVWDVLETPIEGIAAKIIYTEGRYIAVGWKQIAISADGISWDIASIDTPSMLQGIAYGDNVFVATNGYSTFWSADATDWLTVDLPLRNEALLNVIFAESRFMAVTTRGRVYTTKDGLEWHRQYTPTRNKLNALAYGKGRAVAVGWRGTIIVHKKGETRWSKKKSGTKDNLVGVTYGKEGFVAVSSSGKVLRSWNGKRWQILDLSPMQFNSVTYTGSQYVAVGSSGWPSYQGVIMTSDDGEQWNISYQQSLTGDFYSCAGSPTAIVVLGREWTPGLQGGWIELRSICQP